MASKFYKMGYKLAVTYLAIGIFTQTFGHIIRQKEKEKTDNSLKNCALYFTHRVDSCLNPFLTLLKRRKQQKSKSIKLVQKFSQKSFCLRYEETLQCLHETLKACDTSETTRHVQEKLSAPWVLHVNRLCNINMQRQQSMSTENRQETSRDQHTYQTKKLEFNKDTAATVFKDNHQNHDTKLQHHHKGDNLDKTVQNFSLNGVTSSQENTSETAKDNVLKYKPTDTIIKKQTNINVFLNPRGDKTENIFIKKSYSGKVTVTFEQSEDHVKPSTWKTKIGGMLFQQSQPL